VPVSDHPCLGPGADLTQPIAPDRLEWKAKQLNITSRMPRVEPAGFLSTPGLQPEFDEVQRTRVCGRDEDCDGLARSAGQGAAARKPADSVREQSRVRIYLTEQRVRALAGLEFSGAPPHRLAMATLATRPVDVAADRALLLHSARFIVREQDAGRTYSDVKLVVVVVCPPPGRIRTCDTRFSTATTLRYESSGVSVWHWFGGRVLDLACWRW
jgi:hypothetical protein